MRCVNGMAIVKLVVKTLIMHTFHEQCDLDFHYSNVIKNISKIFRAQNLQYPLHTHTHTELSLEYYMNIKLVLTEHHLEFLKLKGASQACLSLHLSEFHIVGNHITAQNYAFVKKFLLAI